jgi:hypothetical protein
MASEKQVVANRANAKRSTGPRTEPGKALSRMNACKHGLTARDIVIRDEDPQEFESLRTALREEWQPRAGMESVLVDRLAGQIWRLRRAPVYEAALMKAHCAAVAASENFPGQLEYQPEHYIGEALMRDARRSDTLGKLSRYEAVLMNGCAKTLQLLIALQSRRAENDALVVEALPTPTPDDA